MCTVDIAIVSPGLLEAKTTRGGGIETNDFKVGQHLSKVFGVTILGPFYGKYRKSLNFDKLVVEEVYFPAVKTYPYVSRIAKNMSFLSVFAYSILIILKLISLKKHGLRLVIIDDSSTGILSAIAARIMMVKVIFSEGNTHPWIEPSIVSSKSTLIKEFGRSMKIATGSLLCKLSQAIRVQSVYIMRGMERNHISPSKINVIGVGVDTDFFKPLPPSNFLLDYTKVGFVGRLVDEKGVPLLLKVVKIASTEWPRLHFIIMGDGPYRKPLSELPNVDSIGYVPMNEIPKRLSEVPIVLFFQRELGLAEFETMACGKAIIACNMGDVPNVIKHLENGILCKPEAESYINSIMFLINNPSIARSISEKARQTAENYYDWTVVSNNWIRLCKVCLKS
jgi:glycosyltransferase involved in cell wall biosynthesis